MDEPEVTKTHGLFGMGCRVHVHIDASASRVWKVLTDSKEFQKGTSIDATFSGTVARDVANWRMTWTAGSPLFRDVRTLTLTPLKDGSTDFTVEERFGGLMMPLIDGPDLAPIFERYANDVKHEAERAA